MAKTADAIYVFEFKLDDQATARDALRQIDGKGYLIPYLADGRKLVKVGAAFNQKSGRLTEWEVA